MNYLVKKEKLRIQYSPGKGAWIYHLIIPNTKHIRAKWGNLKVSGQIDDYKIEMRNLAPVKNSDKILSINETIRKSIGKGAGDEVVVTLYIESRPDLQDTTQIIDCFKDAEVFTIFESLNPEEGAGILNDILTLPTGDQQAEKILKVIEQLLRKSH